MSTARSRNAGELNMLVQIDFYVGADQDFMKAKEIVKEAMTERILPAFREAAIAPPPAVRGLGEYQALRAS